MAAGAKKAAPPRSMPPLAVPPAATVPAADSNAALTDLVAALRGAATLAEQTAAVAAFRTRILKDNDAAAPPATAPPATADAVVGAVRLLADMLGGGPYAVALAKQLHTLVPLLGRGDGGDARTAHVCGGILASALRQVAPPDGGSATAATACAQLAAGLSEDPYVRAALAPGDSPIATLVLPAAAAALTRACAALATPSATTAATAAAAAVEADSDSDNATSGEAAVEVGGGGVTRAAEEVTTSAAKCVLVCLPSPDAVRAVAAAASSSAELQTHLRAAAHACLNVLIAVPFSRDLHVHCSLTLARLFLVARAASPPPAVTLADLLAPPTSVGVPAAAHGDVWGVSAAWTAEVMAALPPRTLIVTLRAVASAFPDGDLLAPSGVVSALEACVLNPLLPYAGHSDDATRCLAFNAMEAVIGAAHRGVAHRSGVAAPLPPLSPAALGVVLEAVMLNWEHASRGVLELMPRLFDRLLDVYDAAGDGRTVIARVAAVAPHRASRYFAVAALVARWGAAPVLAALPSMLGDVLTMAAPSGPSFALNPSAPAFAAVALLASLRTGAEAARGLPPGATPAATISRWRVPGATAADGEVTRRLAAAHPALRFVLLGDATGDTVDDAVVDAALDGVARALMARCRAFTPAGLLAPEGDAAGCAPAVDAVVDAALGAGVLDADTAPTARRVLARADAYHAWAAAWLPTCAALLLHPCRAVRLHTAQYTFPQLLGMDVQSPYMLANLLRASAASGSVVALPPVPTTTTPGSDEPDPEAGSLPERAAWAQLAVARLLRGQDLAVLAADSEAGRRGCAPPDRAVLASTLPLMPATDLHTALYLPDPECRVLALELVAGAGNSTQVPQAQEYDALLAALRNVGKASMPDLRRRMARAVTATVRRAMDGIAALRLRARVVPAAAARAATAGGAPVAAAAAAAAALRDTAAAVTAELHAFLAAAASCALAALTPGAPCDRLLSALEVVGGLFETATGEWASPLAAAALDGAAVTALVAAATAPWERARSLAGSLLQHAPLASLTGARLAEQTPQDAVAGLLRYALTLTASPRELECDGGAVLLRALATRVVVAEGWWVDLTPVVAVSTTRPPAATAPTPLAHLLRQLLLVANRRLVAFRDALAGGGGSATGEPSPLAHGILLALRYILAASPLPPPAAGSDRHAIISDTVAACHAALTAALSVVAGTGESDGGLLAGTTAAAGSSHEALAAGRVDCPPPRVGGGGLAMPASNSVGALADVNTASRNMLVSGAAGGASRALPPPPVALGEPGTAGDDDGSGGGGDGGENEGDGDGDGDGDGGTGGGGSLTYSLVIGAWVVTREVAALLAQVVSCSVIEAPGSPGWYLSTAAVEGIGAALLDAALRLKHVGCITAVAGALRTVAGRLLHPSLRHAAVASLPAAWLTALLHRTAGASQFILRRSAGFAAAFLAILGATVSAGATEALLLPTTHRLLLLCGAPPAALAGAAGAVPPVEAARWAPASWRATVHALNITRLLFRDGALAHHLAPLLPAALQAAVAGFSSPAWAVRNSSVMLFSALLDRTVGAVSRNVTEAAAAGGKVTTSMTAARLMTRYPTLAPFLTAALAACVGGSGGGGGGAGSGVHAGLFPLLVLLSRLAPPDAAVGATTAAVSAAAAADTTVAAGYVAQLRALVSSTLAHRHAFVRRMGARAQAALLPAADRRVTIAAAIAALPDAVAGRDWNAVHGHLLAALAVARVVRAAEGSGGGPLLSNTVAGLPALDALTTTCPLPFIRADALQLTAALDAPAAGRVADAIIGAGAAAAGRLGGGVLVSVASRLAAEAALARGDTAALAAVLAHPLEEARRGAAEAVGEARGVALPELCAVLITALGREGHEPTATTLAASLAARLQVLPATDRRLLAGRPHVWAALLAAVEVARDARTVAPLLLSLGALVEGARLSGAAAGGVARLTALLLPLFDRASRDLRSYAVRFAAARGIAATGVLATIANAPAPPREAGAAWNVITALVCDPDDEVRDAARAAIAAAHAALERPGGGEMSDRLVAVLAADAGIGHISGGVTDRAADVWQLLQHGVLNDVSALRAAFLVRSVWWAAGDVDGGLVAALVAPLVVNPGAIPAALRAMAAPPPLLARPLFVPDADNDYIEAAGVWGVAAAHLAAALAGRPLSSVAGGAHAAAVAAAVATVTAAAAPDAAAGLTALGAGVLTAEGAVWGSVWCHGGAYAALAPAVALLVAGNEAGRVPPATWRALAASVSGGALGRAVAAATAAATAAVAEAAPAASAVVME